AAVFGQTPGTLRVGTRNLCSYARELIRMNSGKSHATSVARWGLDRFTLADGLARCRDNFLLLRMIAAAMVIYGHAFAVTRHPGQSDFFMAQGWGAYSGTIAVD